MREILFRGKRVDNGKWIEGSLSTEYYKECGCVMVSPTSDDCFKVDPETVGQYTGLTDKNGKQIFEGDILGAKHPKQMKAVPCLVKYGEYKDEDGLSDCRYLGFCLQALGKYCSILTPLSDGIEYEVIGNIYDNPELLEGEQ